MAFPVDEAIRELNKAREKALGLREALPPGEHALASSVRILVDKLLGSISGSLSALDVENWRSDNSRSSSSSREIHTARSTTHPHSSTAITSKSTIGDRNTKRKYGQDEIDNNRFQSSLYLRCTHKRQKCFQAKTQIQQSDIITYMGDRSCRYQPETLPFIDRTSSYLIGFCNNTSCYADSLPSNLQLQSYVDAGCSFTTTSLLPEKFTPSSGLTGCGVSAPMAHAMVGAGQSTSSSGLQSPSRILDWDFIVEPFMFGDLTDLDLGFDC